MVNSSDPRQPTRTWSQGRVNMVIIVILAMFVLAGGVYWLMSGIGGGETEVFVDPPPAEGGPPAGEQSPADAAEPAQPAPPGGG